MNIMDEKTETIFKQIQIEEVEKYLISIQFFLHEKKHGRFLNLLKNEWIGNNWSRISYSIEGETGVTFISKFGNLSVNDKLVVKPVLFEGSEDKLEIVLNELEDFFNRVMKMVGGTMFFLESKQLEFVQPRKEFSYNLRVAV